MKLTPEEEKEISTEAAELYRGKPNGAVKIIRHITAVKTERLRERERLRKLVPDIKILERADELYGKSESMKESTAFREGCKFVLSLLGSKQ